MSLARFYLRVFRAAFTHSLSASQDILFLAILLLGAAAAFKDHLPMNLDLGAWAAAASGWQVTALILASIVAVRMACAPYWIWRDEHAIVLATKRELADARREIDTLRISQPSDIVALVNDNRTLLAQVERMTEMLAPDWPLTRAQEQKLRALLAATPKDKRFLVRIVAPPGSENYARRMAAVFRGEEWDATEEAGMLFQASSQGLGIMLSQATIEGKAPMHAEASFLMNGLREAGVNCQTGVTDLVEDDHYAFVVAAPPS